MSYSDTKTVKKEFLNFFKIILTLHLTLLGAKLFAADGVGAKAGGVFGYSVPDADNVNPHRMTGIKGSAYVMPSVLSVGVYSFRTSDEEGTGAERFDYSLHGLEGDVHLGDGNMFVGLRYGISKIKAIRGGENVIFSPYHFGLVSGYDYPLFSWLLVGFEGSYLFVKGTNTEQNNVSYDLDHLAILNFLATLQIRL